MFSQSSHIQINYFKTTFKQRVLDVSDVHTLGSQCPVCNASVLTLAEVSGGADQVVLAKSFCAQCSYVYFSKLPRQNWFVDFYRDQWDTGSSSKGPKKFDPASYQKNMQFIHDFAQDKNQSILDIGVGYGEFLTRCQHEGYQNVHGIEASQRRVDYCRSGGRALDVELGTIESFGAQTKRQFDVIHSHHVIEHVYDINQSIGNIRNLLRPNGIVVFFVPNIFDEHFLLLTHCLVHIRNFTTRSLATLLDKHQFQIERMADDIGVVARKVDNPDNTQIFARLPSAAQIATTLEQKLRTEYSASSFQDNAKQIWGATGWRKTDGFSFLQKAIFQVKRLIFGYNSHTSNFMRTYARKVLNRLTLYYGSEFGGKLQYLDRNVAPLPVTPLLRVSFTDGLTRVLLK